MYLSISISHLSILANNIKRIFPSRYHIFLSLQTISNVSFHLDITSFYPCKQYQTYLSISISHLFILANNIKRIFPSRYHIFLSLQTISNVSFHLDITSFYPCKQYQKSHSILISHLFILANNIKRISPSRYHIFLSLQTISKISFHPDLTSFYPCKQYQIYLSISISHLFILANNIKRISPSRYHIFLSLQTTSNVFFRLDITSFYPCKQYQTYFSISISHLFILANNIKRIFPSRYHIFLSLQTISNISFHLDITSFYPCKQYQTYLSISISHLFILASNIKRIFPSRYHIFLSLQTISNVSFHLDITSFYPCKQYQTYLSILISHFFYPCKQYQTYLSISISHLFIIANNIKRIFPSRYHIFLSLQTISNVSFHLDITSFYHCKQYQTYHLIPILHLFIIAKNIGHIKSWYSIFLSLHRISDVSFNLDIKSFYHCK